MAPISVSEEIRNAIAYGIERELPHRLSTNHLNYMKSVTGPHWLSTQLSIVQALQRFFKVQFHLAGQKLTQMAALPTRSAL